MFLLDARIDANGRGATTTLEVTGGALRVSLDGEVQGELPIGAIDLVMGRYGKPLADGVSPQPAPSLDLGDGGALRTLRHRAYYDVIARDFVVLERPGVAPVAELATTVASALTHLARAASSAR